MRVAIPPTRPITTNTAKVGPTRPINIPAVTPAVCSKTLKNVSIISPIPFVDKVLPNY